MVMVVQDSKGEIEEFVKGGAPKEEPKTEAKAETKAEPKPEVKEDDDEAPEWVTRLKVTPEQHRGITEVVKRAIDKKHRQAKEAEEFAAAQYNERRLAEERAEKAARELEEIRKAAQPLKEKQERPDRTKFTDQNAYEDALLAWNRAEAIREFKENEAKEREEARKEQIMTAAKARVAKAIELVPDFAEVTGAADDIIPSHIAAYMQESELFPELGYHFAKHPEDLQKLAAMPSRTYSDLLKVGVALDKIESKIQPFSKEKANDAAKANSNGHAPTQDTGTVPSQTKVSAPVIMPLNVGSSAQVEKPANRRTYEEERAFFERKHGRDLSRRSRH